MGYYSAVSLSMYDKDIKGLIKRAIDENNIEVIELIRMAHCFKREDVVTLFWSCVKWYDTFSEVNFIESYMRDFQYSFKRVGENAGDIKEEYNDDEFQLVDTTFIYCELGYNEVGSPHDIEEDIDIIYEEQSDCESGYERAVSTDELLSVIGIDG